MWTFWQRHRAIKWTIEIILLVSILFALRAWMQRDIVSGMAPPIDAFLLDGNPVQLTHYRGAPLLVHFWASWCGICRFEEQGIEAIASDYPVISIAMQSGDAGEVGAYMQQRGLTFPVVADPDGRLAAAYGVSAVPASFIIDAQGQIRFVELGYTTEIGLRVRLRLANWL